ncbi:DMT family transporter [Halobacillus sp. H74]|uniref:DMT family transporter n=1 Tax=Halobacillus sp. H74 TaxID=3457436 RepID=UPI003FCD9A41
MKKFGGFVKRIYILLMLVMLVWGFNVSAIKVLVAHIDPILLTSVRVFTAGIGVLVIMSIMGLFRLPSKKELLTILSISLFNVVAHHALMGVGLLYTSGVNAGIIIGLGPLLTMVLSTILLSKKVTVFKTFGFLLGFTGVLITTLTGEDGFAGISSGDFMIFLSITAQAFSFIMISKLNPNLDPRLLTGYMLLGGSFFIFFTSLFLEGEPGQILALLDTHLFLVFLFSALICTAFGHMVYNFAIKQVGASESAVFINFNSFFAVVGSVLFLEETLFFAHIIGLVLIIAGVLIGTGALQHLWENQKRYRKKSA